MVKVLFVLQNAYTNDIHKFKNKREWSKELYRSHTGRRLHSLIPTDVCKPFVINASPLIGNTPNDCFVADLDYLRKSIDRLSPDLVVGCGVIAQKGLDDLGIRHYKIPHPAYRAFSKKMARDIREQIEIFCKVYEMVL